MGKRSRAACVWLLAFGGCGGRETVELGFERDAASGARTLILAFDELPAKRPIYDTMLAIDLDAELGDLNLPALAALPPGSGAEATAIYLRAPLELLGLEPGPIAQWPPDARDGATLQSFAARSFLRAETLRLEPGESEPERRVVEDPGALPPRLAALRIDPGCARFKPENGHVNTCRNLAFSARLGPELFLFGSRCQRFFLATVSGDGVSVERTVSPLGVLEPEATFEQCSLEGRSPNTPGFVPKRPAIHSARADGNGNFAYGGLGRIYLHARTGEKREIELPEVQGEVGEEPGVFWLAGNPDMNDSSFELFAMTAKGRVLRVTLDDGAPRVEALHDFAFAAAEDEGFGGLASAGPGHVVAVAPRDTRVFVYRQGRTPLITGPSGFATAAAVPGLGVLIGAEAGRVYRLGDDDVVHEYEQPLGWSSRIEGLGGFRRGFLFGGTNGYIGEHSPSRGFCETRQLASAAPRALYAIGEPGAEDRVFVITGTEQSRDRNAYGLLIPPAAD